MKLFYPNLEETKLQTDGTPMFEIPASSCRISKDGKRIIILNCPRCGQMHVHGLLKDADKKIPEGHRVPHCGDSHIPRNLPHYVLPAPFGIPTITGAELRHAEGVSLSFERAEYRLTQFRPKGKQGAKQQAIILEQFKQDKETMGARILTQTQKLVLEARGETNDKD